MLLIVSVHCLAKMHRIAQTMQSLRCTHPICYCSFWLAWNSIDLSGIWGLLSQAVRSFHHAPKSSPYLSSQKPSSDQWTFIRFFFLADAKWCNVKNISMARQNMFQLQNLSSFSYNISGCFTWIFLIIILFNSSSCGAVGLWIWLSTSLNCSSVTAKRNQGVLPLAPTWILDKCRNHQSYQICNLLSTLIPFTAIIMY